MYELKNFQFNNTELTEVNDFIQSHNSAVLAIVFSDIVGYTALYEKVGDKKARCIN